jgi:hypothetical protein
MSNRWDKLDAIMRQFSPRLREEFDLAPQASNRLASTLAFEVSVLPPEVLGGIRDNDMVGLQRRIEELTAFEQFMSLTTSDRFPPLTRAQVVCQLYISFVYLGDACFIGLRNAAAAGSALRKCCTYLTDYPVRGLRNAVAHSNWRYADDFTGLVFYYFEDEQMTKRKEYTVKQLELDFWDKLARVTAYAAFQTINEVV